jgi:S4 domain protein YaaA
MRRIVITSEYITLGQLLKYASILQSGGEARAFLAETKVSVNGLPENRRGRKLYPGDRVSILTTPRVDLAIDR